MRRASCRRWSPPLIISGVLVVVELIGLPPAIEVAFGVFTVFAALKISYGASIRADAGAVHGPRW